MFGHDLNPHYFANPPAFTYVLHIVFAVWFGGGAGARHALASHPSEVYTLARVVAALLGTAALWLLYATGARLFGRGVGLLAAAIEAVAFLPVFYAHLALNDVPTLAPLTLSLLGSAGVLRKGRLRDYLLAGIGLGLACATKYTAGIVVLPLVAAATTRYLRVEPGERAYLIGRRAVTGFVLAGTGALVAFVVANPYAVLDFQSFHSGLVHQSTLSGEAQGKLGAPKEGGVLYYLWSLTWGLGWVPALAALGARLDLIAACGVDAFFAGGTKNGALCGEAVVLVSNELRRDFRYHMKQRGALLAKGRLLGIQFARLFDGDDLWYRLGNQANAAAARLARGLSDCGVPLRAAEANQVFVELPGDAVGRLAAAVCFHVWSRGERSTLIRLVCSWATDEATVDRLVDEVRWALAPPTASEIPPG